MKIRPVGAELFHADEQTDIFAILRTRLKTFHSTLGHFLEDGRLPEAVNLLL